MYGFCLAIILNNLRFKSQALFPTGIYINIFTVFFCQADKHSVMGSLADHQFVIKGR